MVVAVNNPALNNIQQILISNLSVGDGESLNLSLSEIQQVTVSNEENMHEYAVITMHLTKAQIDRFIGKTIKFDYGPVNRRNTFFGYIVTINPNQQYQQDAIVDIACLGPTWVMQTGRPSFYTNTTIPALVGNIVTGNPYQLGCQVDDHPYTWPSLAQTSESDWEFLRTLATRIGYCLYLYKGIVRLVDPVRILSETDVVRRLIRADDVIDPTRQILDFSPSSQSLKLRENIQPAFGYFKEGPNGTQVPAIKGNLDSIPYRMSTEVPIKDEGMAVSYYEAWSRRIDHWSQSAAARINGDASLLPGTNVSVQISTTSNGRNDYDGVWLIRGVQHSLTNNSFQTQLALARDNRIDRKVNPNVGHFLSAISQSGPTMTKSTNAEKWISSITSVETIKDTIKINDRPTISVPFGFIPVN